MGFLNNAKKKLQQATRGIGEETIHVVDYDEEQETQEVAQPRQKSEPEVLSSYNESAFEIDDESDEYFKKQEEAHQELLKTYGDAPVPKVLEGRIQDVLDLLNIPPTFEIDATVLLPEDFKEVSFDIQVPQGYEMGEVNSFVSRAKHSVKELVKLLKLRNKHIAELATTVDRLQVDANNLKFQAEIANGINIMPTDDNEDIENENMELRLLVKRMEDQLKSLQNGSESDQLTSKERQFYEAISDKLSVLQREYDEIKEENYSLKNQLAVYQDEETLLEEGSDDSDTVLSYDEPGESNFHTDDDEEDGLPSFGDDDFTPLVRTDSIPEISSNSAFANDNEESLDTFLEQNSEFYQGHDYSSDDSGIELMNDDGSFSNIKAEKVGTYYEDDNEDDDDELDAIFNSDRRI